MSAVLAFGTSAGGVNALIRIFERLPKDFACPIIVVQHLSSSTSIDVQTVYGENFKRRVYEIEDKMPIEEGITYMAPGGYHVMIERDRTFALNVDEPVNYSRPSIDVFFESAGRAFHRDLIGVLMTGANQDGASGLKVAHELGAKTIVQSVDDAEYKEMPRAALAMFEPTYVATVAEMPELIVGLCKEVSR